LFGESASRAIISAAPGSSATLLEMARAAGLPARIIGKTGGGRLRITIDGRPVLDMAVAEAEQIWTSGLEKYFASRAA
jgi:phosphoribosylformylglycinamidine synthase